MDTQESAPRFFNKHILPALLVFVIPLFSVWFFDYAERKTDREVMESIERTINKDTTLTPPEKQVALEMFRAHPVSEIMASDSPKTVPLQAMFEPTKNRYATFRWMQWIAWVCLGSVVATFLLVGVSVACSFQSHAAQYWSLRIGLPILRTSALIQVLGQALLAGFLSFWVTAIFFEIYIIKLIVLIGILAAAGVFALVAAVFRRVDEKCAVEGRMLSDEEAPALWRKIREMAAKLQTEPPDRVIVGIAPSFFVTEHPVELNGARHEGRTLFLSLPMLKILSMSEADAVLGHELAHFSGQDTLWSRKISPLMGNFALYLQALGDGLGLLVGQFMLVFWKLYLFSLGRRSREREFRADQVGAGLTSAEAMRRALIKVSGYCEYRARAEQAVMEQNRVNPNLRLAEALELGYSDFLKRFTSDEKAALSETPHPFDSHPPLDQRLESLGLDALQALKENDLHAPLAGTWHDAMPTAPMVEKAMWAEREAMIQAVHGQDLAWRLLPTGTEETEFVLAYFPEKVFTGKAGTSATLTFKSVHVSSWPEPLLFAQIEGAQMEDSTFGGKKLVLFHRPIADAKVTKVKFCPADFTNAEGAFLPMFQLYYSRHKTAEARSRGN